MASVVNPPIPYIGGIPGGLKDGTKIVIHGQVAHHQHQFTVNLACGTNLEPRSDTALHFNVRFHENCVVRNSLQHGSWEGEERHGGLPFQRGMPFEIRIIAQHNQYKIKVNGNDFAHFNHRIPKHRVNTLTIEGDVFISSIMFEGNVHPGHHGSGGYLGDTIAGIAGAIFGGGGGNKPRMHPPPPQPGFPPSQPAYPPPGGAYPTGGAMQPIYNPPVPFTTGISGGMYPGKMIFISGVSYPNASRFTVNLQCGPYDAADIGLHFDVRIRVGGDCNVVVRNHHQGGQWGSEERHSPYFPFMPNANFDMIIMAEGNCFKVAANNQHLFEFFHRLQPISRIDHLKITGDLRLTQIRFQ
uniref:Galectin n=1 Tax=Tegillarca granosa TaxID=220873 RepID=M4PM45_TEGGR|nr:galectin [Tegillarca granosa]